MDAEISKNAAWISKNLFDSYGFYSERRMKSTFKTFSKAHIEDYLKAAGESVCYLISKRHQDGFTIKCKSVIVMNPRLESALVLTYLQRHIQRAMARWAYYNNDFIPETACTVPAGDLAVQRGYGLFDFFKTVQGTPVFLDEHIERFYRSAEAMRLPVGMSETGLKMVLLQLIERNGLPDSGIRLTLTGGASPDGFALAAPNLIITQQPLQLPAPAVFERGLRLATYEHQRQLPHVKSIDYLMAIWLQPWLEKQGADDVLYHHNHSITECPRANFFTVREDNRIQTPDQQILEGITRAHVLQLAGAQAIACPVAVNDLKSAREAFITSTTKGVLPVTVIDGHTIGNGKPGPVTRQLAAALKQQVAGFKI